MREGNEEDCRAAQCTPSPKVTEDTPAKLSRCLHDLAACPHFFGPEEVRRYGDPGLSRGIVATALRSDPRFVVLASAENGGFVASTRRTLLNWLVHINKRLAAARVYRLTATRLHRLALMRAKGTLPAGFAQAVAEHSAQPALIASAATPGHFVFPLALCLSCLESSAIPSIDSVWEDPQAFWLDEGDVQGHTLEGVVDTILSSCSERTKLVVRRRHGLSGKESQTLVRIARALRLSRQRVSQIDVAFLGLFETRIARKLPLVSAILSRVIQQNGSLFFPAEDRVLRFAAKCVGLPYVKVPEMQSVLLAHTHGSVQSLKDAAISVAKKEQMDTEALAQTVDMRALPCLIESDLRSLCTAWQPVLLRKLTNVQKARIALREIGEPAHYSRVAEKWLRLFPDDAVTEHSVHAALQRPENRGIVVWVGRHGRYALADWGDERPSATLFESVTRIVRTMYARTGKPVHRDVILAEMGRLRKIVNPNSVRMAADLNPDVVRLKGDFYVPREALGGHDEDTSADEIDRVLRDFAGDL